LTSSRVPAQLWKVTLYRDDSLSPVVYTDVKHAFWTGNNSVFVLAIVDDLETGAHHYVSWLREHFVWFKKERT